MYDLGWMGTRRGRYRWLTTAAVAALCTTVPWRVSPAVEPVGSAPADLDSLRGKVVVLNFWATWCAPCVEELPELDRLAKDLANLDVAIVAVAVEPSGDSPRVQRFLAERRIDLPLWIGAEPDDMRRLGLRGGASGDGDPGSGRRRGAADPGIFPEGRSGASRPRGSRGRSRDPFPGSHLRGDQGRVARSLMTDVTRRRPGGPRDRRSRHRHLDRGLSMVSRPRASGEATVYRPGPAPIRE